MQAPDRRHRARDNGSFYVSESPVDGGRVITPCGELDLSTAARLEEQLAGHCDTVLDLSELTFIDSSGIHLVISTAQRARSEGWSFTVRDPQPAVLRVIELLGLTEHLGLIGQTEQEPLH
jgi:anti-anti-sigma factor